MAEKVKLPADKGLYLAVKRGGGGAKAPTRALTADATLIGWLKPRPRRARQQRMQSSLAGGKFPHHVMSPKQEGGGKSYGYITKPPEKRHDQWLRSYQTARSRLEAVYPLDKQWTHWR